MTQDRRVPVGRAEGWRGRIQGPPIRVQDLEILRKKRSDYADKDLDHMRKIDGYVSSATSTRSPRATSRIPTDATRS